MGNVFHIDWLLEAFTQQQYSIFFINISFSFIRLILIGWNKRVKAIYSHFESRRKSLQICYPFVVKPTGGDGTALSKNVISDSIGTADNSVHNSRK